MTRFLTATAAASFILAAAAQAQTTAADVAEQMRAAGYSNVEIKRGAGRIAIEGTRDGNRETLVYDARTGRLLSSDRDDDHSDDDRRGDDRHRDDDYRYKKKKRDSIFDIFD